MLIWIAPSGGRDRPNEQGEFLPDKFDPSAVELMRSLVSRAKKVGLQAGAGLPSSCHSAHAQSLEHELALAGWAPTGAPALLPLLCSRGTLMAPPPHALLTLLLFPSHLSTPWIPPSLSSPSP